MRYFVGVLFLAVSATAFRTCTNSTVCGDFGACLGIGGAAEGVCLCEFGYGYDKDADECVLDEDDTTTVAETSVAETTTEETTTEQSIDTSITDCSSGGRSLRCHFGGQCLDIDGDSVCVCTNLDRAGDNCMTKATGRDAGGLEDITDTILEDTRLLDPEDPFSTMTRYALESLEGCQAVCETTSGCVSVNFNEDLSVCELHAVGATWKYNEQGADFEDWTHDAEGWTHSCCTKNVTPDSEESDDSSSAGSESNENAVTE